MVRNCASPDSSNWPTSAAGRRRVRSVRVPFHQYWLMVELFGEKAYPQNVTATMMFRSPENMGWCMSRVCRQTPRPNLSTPANTNPTFAIPELQVSTFPSSFTNSSTTNNNGHNPHPYQHRRSRRRWRSRRLGFLDTQLQVHSNFPIRPNLHISHLSAK
jgi:hypothetical protein